MKHIIGIDPGQSGGMAMLFNSKTPMLFKFKDKTNYDVYDELSLWKEVVLSHSSDGVIVYLELVHSMPAQGVSSTFNFGVSYGFLQGLITALQMPMQFVTPQKWQKALGCRTKGDKNITKFKAQQLYPEISKEITHAVADALLIAHYGKELDK